MRATPGLDKFMAVYRPALLAAVEAHPDEYALGGLTIVGNLGTVTHPPVTPAEFATRTGDKMARAFAAGDYNHAGRAIKATCKALGIKPTRTAIEQFLTTEI